MGRIPKRLILGFTLFWVAANASATTLVIQKEISVSHLLAGRVLVGGIDEPASGVTVELCSRDWKTALASTKTDEKGYFSLRQPAAGRLFYLRVWAPGMNIYDLRVRISKKTAKELTIRLSVAT